MLTKEAAKRWGSGLGADHRRRETLARAIVTLAKKASMTKAAGAEAAAQIPWGVVLKKIAPWLGAGIGGIGAGIGGYLLGGRGKQKQQQPAPGMPYGMPRRPLWNPYEQAMFARMGINPMEMAARQRGMFDVGFGGQWRAAEQRMRQNLLKSMYTI